MSSLPLQRQPRFKAPSASKATWCALCPQIVFGDPMRIPSTKVTLMYLGWSSKQLLFAEQFAGSCWSHNHFLHVIQKLLVSIPHSAQEPRLPASVQDFVATLTLDSGTPVHALIRLWTATSAGTFGGFLYHSLTNFFGVTPSEIAPHATSFVRVSYFRVWIPLVFEMKDEETSVSDDLCFIESTIFRRVSWKELRNDAALQKWLRDR